MNIFLDPGHGGDDSGCVFGPFHEAEWVYPFCLDLAQELKARGHHVELSRTAHEDPAHAVRQDRAQAMRADLALLVHVNSGHGEEHGPLVFRNFGDLAGERYAAKLLKTLDRAGEYVEEHTLKIRPMRSQQHIARPLAAHWTYRAWCCLAPYEGRLPAALLECEYITHEPSRAWLLGAGRAQLLKACAEALSALKGD